MNKKEQKIYNIVPRLPVACLYYKGNHTHPIRRTLLITKETETHITGYEFRCGNVVRSRKEALSKVRTYRKDRIAKWGDYSRLTMSIKNFMKDPEASTLERHSISMMFKEGA